MSLSNKYAILKEGVPFPEKWRGDISRCLIDLRQVNDWQISGRQAGHVERFTVKLRDVDIFDDPK